MWTLLEWIKVEEEEDGGGEEEEAAEEEAEGELVAASLSSPLR